MKKLIGLLVLLFITTGVFGQAFIRKSSFIEVTEGFINHKFPALTIAEVILDDNITEDFDWIRYIHFVKDGKLFILSYELKEDLEKIGFSRGIYLYSKEIHNVNSPWKKASAVIMTNSFSENCYDEVDFFLAEKSRDSVGKVEFNDDGSIEITIGWILMDNVNNNCVDHVLKYSFVANPYGKVDYLHQRVYK